MSCQGFARASVPRLCIGYARAYADAPAYTPASPGIAGAKPGLSTGLAAATRAAGLAAGALAGARSDETPPPPRSKGAHPGPGWATPYPPSGVAARGLA